jgi:AcrR family transcriptional regulator
MTRTTPTRQRIVETATTLFAAQGIRQTTVAQIEAEVGLRPGSGGLHRHFATKNDLIRAVLDAQVERAASHVTTAVEPPAAEDLRSALRQLGQRVLHDADEHRDVALIMLREAHSIPRDVLDEQHRKNFALSYEAVAARLRDDYPALLKQGIDPDALAFLMIAPLIYHRIVEWALGETILGLNDERLVDTWAETFHPILETGAGASSPAAPGRRGRSASPRTTRASR